MPMSTSTGARAETADLHSENRDLIWQNRDLQLDVETLDELVQYWRGVALDAQERADRAEQRLDRTVAVLTGTEDL